MHPFLLIPLILLVIVLFAVWYHYNIDDYNPVVILLSIFGSLALMLCSIAALANNNWIIKEWPVEYTTEAITSKIFVHTKYGEFESDRKIDFDNWSKNLPGYITQHCNAFGSVITTNFNVQKP